MRTSVFCRAEFEATHCWPEAAQGSSEAYLASPHRHVFKVEVTVPVSHSDRDVEFIELKRRVLELIERRWPLRGPGPRSIGRSSCEDVAAYLASETGASRVTVSEDGENGAVVEAG